MAALSLPLGEVQRNERSRECQVLAQNFVRGAEALKKKTEEEWSNRLLRQQVFESRIADVVEETDRQELVDLFQEHERRLTRASRQTWSTRDLEQVRVLGKGAFGVVHLARQRGNGHLVAVKQMLKGRYREKNLRDRAFSERQILAEAANRWFVGLLATFQDPDNVYMVMEFLQGGDLLTHLERKGRFSEEETRFYMGEMFLAVDVVHKAGFVHRDIKPDNVVLTVEGHLKLLDFGLCKQDPTAEPMQLDSSIDSTGLTRRQRMRSARGTPQYMAPEATVGEVHPSSDIWAIGVMTYECLTGSVMFWSDVNGPQNQDKVVQQVRNHRQVFPKRIRKGLIKGYLRKDAVYFLTGIICDVGQRLTVEQCKQEPFFENKQWNWENLHLQVPPIVPRRDLRGDADTCFFPDPESPLPLPEAAMGPGRDAALEWSGYEFDKVVHELQQPKAVEALLLAQEFEAATTDPSPRSSSSCSSRDSSP